MRGLSYDGAKWPFPDGWPLAGHAVPVGSAHATHSLRGSAGQPQP
jgi:hypothetical protein